MQEALVRHQSYKIWDPWECIVHETPEVSENQGGKGHLWQLGHKSM